MDDETGTSAVLRRVGWDIYWVSQFMQVSAVFPFTKWNTCNALQVVTYST